MFCIHDPAWKYMLDKSMVKKKSEICFGPGLPLHQSLFCPALPNNLCCIYVSVNTRKQEKTVNVGMHYAFRT